MSGKSHHVVPNHEGGWDVKKSGSERASGHYETKADAVKDGRQISRNQGTELFIHRKDGQFKQKDSHGPDKCPPRG